MRVHFFVFTRKRYRIVHDEHGGRGPTDKHLGPGLTNDMGHATTCSNDERASTWPQSPPRARVPRPRGDLSSSRSGCRPTSPDAP